MYASGRHHLMFFLKEKVTHRRTVQIFKQLNETQWFSRDKLQELQWRRLKLLLRYAYKNAPYYNTLFKNLKLTFGDFKEFEDLRKIPLLTKQILRENMENLSAKNFKGHKTIHRTSGSTGMPLQIPVDSITESYSLANAIRGKSWWGLKVGEKELKFWGTSTPFEKTLKGKLISQVKKLKDKALSSTHLSPFDTSYENLLKYYKILIKKKPKYIFGYGVAIYIFAKFILDNNLHLNNYRPKVVVYTTETLYQFQKDLINRVFGCPVICEYGAVEMGIIAYECPKGNLHLCDETLYVEVVESQKKGLKKGFGEIVITHLTNYSFPLIRYNLGDIVSLSKEKCSCRRGLSVLGRLSGRSNDLIRKPNGEYIHPELFDYIMRHQTGVKRYRVIEKTTGHLYLLLEMEHPLTEKQKNNLNKNLVHYIGDNFKIEIEVRKKIPNDPSGKFRWVISQ